MKACLLVLLCTWTATAAAQTATPQPAAVPPATAVKQEATGSDPRVCLEFPTREQVIACAEKYRPRRPVPKA